MQQLLLKIRVGLSKLFGRQNGVYYVNGPDLLPPPLTREEESALLEDTLDEATKKHLTFCRMCGII